MTFPENNFDKLARVEQVVQRRFDLRGGGVASSHPKSIDTQAPIVTVTNVNDPVRQTLMLSDQAGPGALASPEINFTNSDVNDESILILRGVEFFEIKGLSCLAQTSSAGNWDYVLTVTYQLADGTAIVTVPVEGVLSYGAAATRYRNLMRDESQTRVKTTLLIDDVDKDQMQARILSLDLITVRNSGGNLTLTDNALTLELLT